MIRVLHLRNSDRLGGPERLILDQVALASPALEPTIASFARPGVRHPFLDAAAEAGLRTLRIEQRHSYDPRALGDLRRALATALRSPRPDVLVGHDYKANLYLALAASGSGLPRAAVVHGYTAEDTKVRFFEAVDRRVLRTADAVVAVSPATADALAGGGIPRDRLHVVENGVAVDRVAGEARAARAAVRAAWGVAEGDVVVLALGRLSPEKGHAVLLDAFAQARRDRPGREVLVLVGDGPSRVGLEVEASRLVSLGLLRAGDVRFEGWRADPWACLGAADLLALPSLREGLPLALLEAMAAGVPVVATRVGGVPEALDDGRCGILVPPGDAAALSRGISEALSDPARRRTLAAAALARVRASYSSERQARALEAIWSSLVRGPTGP